MAKRYPYKDDSGSTVLITSNSEYFTDNMDINDSKSELYLEFFEDYACTMPVTPTSGTVEVLGSPMGNVYLSSSSSQVINASDVSYPDGNYTPPILDGMMVRSKIKLVDIEGANYMLATMYKH